MPMNLGLGLGLSRRAASSGGGGNVAPVITGVPTISGTATVGNVLTASPASVTGTPSPTRTWQWVRDGVDISGATSITYTLTGEDYGVTITVRQTETNVAGSANATSLGTAIAPFTPAELFTSGIVGAWSSRIDTADLWQDTARTTPVTATGQSVASWRVNTSSGSIYMQQGTAAARPTYQVDGNGVPYLNFDGSNDQLDSSATFALSGSTESTMMVAVDTEGSFAENKGYISLSSGVSTNANRVIGQTAAGGMKVDIVGTNTTAPSIPTVFAVLEGKFSGTTISAAVDGGSFTTATGAINTTNNLSIFLGRGAASAWAGGRYYGFLHIVKALTPTERANLVAWMTALGNP